MLDHRNKPGVVVVVTDGEETCGRSPCELEAAEGAKSLNKRTCMESPIILIAD